MPWYTEAVTKFFKEYYKTLVSATIFILLLVIYHLLFGSKFEKELVCQLPEPSFTLRMLSGLVFATLGWALYQLRVYYVLYILLVVILRLRELYNALKKVIWYSLMFIMGFVIVPWIIDQLNLLFLYICNVPLFLAHLFPPYGLSLVAFILFVIVGYKKRFLKS
jgi:hypothetical protein